MRNFLASFGVAVVVTSVVVAILLVPTTFVFIYFKFIETLTWSWGLILTPLWVLLAGIFGGVMAFAFKVLNE